MQLQLVHRLFNIVNMAKWYLKPELPKAGVHRFMVMYALPKVAMLDGQLCLKTANGITRIPTMGDMEMIGADGVRATFTDSGVELDIVPLNECCEWCNDPRMLNINGVRKCAGCGCVNHIEYKTHE
jgi:hypothetical protein